MTPKKRQLSELRARSGRGARRLDVLDNLRFVCAVRKQMHDYPEEAAVHAFPPLLGSSHSFILSAFSASVLPSNIKF